MGKTSGSLAAVGKYWEEECGKTQNKLFCTAKKKLDETRGLAPYGKKKLDVDETRGLTHKTKKCLPYGKNKVDKF